MRKDSKKLKYLYRAPRILGLVIIAFLAIFALDVFIPGRTIGYYVVALFMHLIPNIILAVALIIAWKFEKAGAILFLLIGVLMTIFFETYRAPLNFLLISFPIFLIGTLFLLHNFLKTN